MRIKQIICLYGGPGSGKTTTCAGLFYKLKLRHFNAEMNQEYIKNWVWEGRDIKPGDQTYFFAKQSRKERMLILQKLDFIITDSPLVLTNFYGQKYDSMEKEHNTSLNMLQNHHEFCKKHDYKVEHFFLNRAENYTQSGRFQTETEARALDEELKAYLRAFPIKFHEVDATETTVDEILGVLEGLSKS